MRLPNNTLEWQCFGYRDVAGIDKMASAFCRTFLPVTFFSDLTS